MDADIERLEAQLNAVEEEVGALVRGLDEASGRWTASPGSWSIAQCLDHLATFNCVYLAPMQQGADRARAQGKLRRGPAIPGRIGGWLVAQVEPPVKPRTRFKATSNIQPAPAPLLAEACSSFATSHQQVRTFLLANADLDLAHIRFANPILRGIRFSLATGLQIIASHERRHLWQAREVLRLHAESINSIRS